MNSVIAVIINTLQMCEENLCKKILKKFVIKKFYK
jgi:hypothetical protein